MATARKRFDNPALKSWDEADLHLKEIAEIDIQLQTIEAGMNLKISDAKLAAEMDAKPLQDRKEKLSLEIKDFAEDHKCEFAGKTKNLNFGKCGFRQSTKILISKIASCIAALKAKGLTDCIKSKEEVNKDILRTKSDDVIASVGARKKVEDVFWLEPDYEKLK
ncbi:MAG: host-nuclease inhibitor Gam family protein [Negativicutes bacterium]